MVDRGIFLNRVPEVILESVVADQQFAGVGQVEMRFGIVGPQARLPFRRRPDLLDIAEWSDRTIGNAQAHLVRQSHFLEDEQKPPVGQRGQAQFVGHRLDQGFQVAALFTPSLAIPVAPAGPGF